MRTGAICYLDEVVEARKDTTVVLHPLADDRRALPIEQHEAAVAGRNAFRAGHVVQPRLPKRSQLPEAQHPSALRALDMGYLHRTWNAES